MWDFRLYSGKGKKVAAAVTNDHEVCTITAPYPPLTLQKVQAFRQYLTVDGTADGDKEMGVNGSVNHVEYYIEAHESEDRYITTLSFILSYGGAAQPYLFADGTELTNGIHLFYGSQRGVRDIHDSIKTNQDFFRLSFSPVTTDWQIRGVGSNNDYGYFITMDLTKLGLPFGVKLDRGTNQRLSLRVHDDLSVILGGVNDSFNCIAYGFDRFE